MSDPVSRSTEVRAPADRVWALVSDLPRMGELSPESTGGRWTGGASGPALGATFRGTNRQGARVWATTATVSACEPGRSFAFDVRAVGLPVARWAYEIAPTDGGCRVTETWTDLRGRLLRATGGVMTGVADRQAYAATSMEHTLARVKERAEQG